MEVDCQSIQVRLTVFRNLLDLRGWGIFIRICCHFIRNLFQVLQNKKISQAASDAVLVAREMKHGGE
jgi:hypothetical protein